MPRKQNGWGNTRSFSVNSVNNRTDKSKGVQGSGQYPSDRRFGSTVTRSAVQQWNLDSTWMMWRKGYEYARRNIWVNLDVLFFAFLFSGTTSRLRANFRCKRFPSLKNDTATRYVVKREIESSTIDPRYATVQNIINIPPPPIVETDNEKRRKNNFDNKEIWLEVSPQTPISTRGNVLKRLVHERITNKRHGTNYTETKTYEATVKTVLKNNGLPLIYSGVSHGKETFIEITIPRDEVLDTEYVEEKGLDKLIGQVIRPTNMPVAMAKTGLTFRDQLTKEEELEKGIKSDVNKIYIDMDMTLTNQTAWIANVSNQDPFEVFVDPTPLLILTTNNASFNMRQQFELHKSEYQKYFDYYIDC